jgi:hypothetical protein
MARLTAEVNEVDSGRALGETLNQAARDIRDQLQGVAKDGGHVNVGGRHNVVVTGSVGSDSESHAASSSQTVRIRQEGGKTVEEVVTSTDATGP